jgi:uncharacterized membrane protein YraQ (UPF0718 family)
VSKTLIPAPVDLEISNIVGGVFNLPETFLSKTYLIFGYEITAMHILFSIIIIGVIIYFLYKHFLQKKKEVVVILDKSTDNITENSSSSSYSSSSTNEN